MSYLCRGPITRSDGRILNELSRGPKTLRQIWLSVGEKSLREYPRIAKMIRRLRRFGLVKSIDTDRQAKGRPANVWALTRAGSGYLDWLAKTLREEHRL